MNYKAHILFSLVFVGLGLLASQASENAVFESVKEEIQLVDGELLGAPADSVYIAALLKLHETDARITFLFSKDGNGVLECKTTIQGLATKGLVKEVILKQNKIPTELINLKNAAYKARELVETIPKDGNQRYGLFVYQVRDSRGNTKMVDYLDGTDYLNKDTIAKFDSTVREVLIWMLVYGGITPPKAFPEFKDLKFWEELGMQWKDRWIR